MSSLMNNKLNIIADTALQSWVCYFMMLHHVIVLEFDSNRCNMHITSHVSGNSEYFIIFLSFTDCVKVDPVVDAAAKASGLDVVEIKSYLPAGLTIWIDPREVSCRLTENGPVQVIYRAGSGVASELTQGVRRGAGGSDGDEVEADRELQRVRWGYDSITTGGRVPDVSPSPGWSSTGGSGGGTSTVAGGNTRILQPPATTTCFTAATFAQTKFGSTKMKSQGPQRPSRLSPIEMPPGGFPTRLSPSSAPLSACWGLSPTGGLSPTVNGLSPMQQNPSAQFGIMSGAGGDARPASLQDWILLHHHQQQVQYMAALKQQQQQQQRGMTSTSHHPLVACSANTRLASPHLYDTTVRQHLQLPQLQQPVPPRPTHGLMSLPDVGLYPPLTHDSNGTARLDPALKDDGVRLSPAEGVDWGLDMALSGYAPGLQQLLLAN